MIEGLALEDLGRPELSPSPSFSTRARILPHAFVGSRGESLDFQLQVFIIDLDPLGVGYPWPG